MNNNDCSNYIESKEILKRYPREKRYTLAILQDVQKLYSYIPSDVIEYMSEYLNIHTTEIYSIATFYKALSLKAKGKFIIKVCNGTACHIRGSNILLDEITNILNINPDETTEDGLFSLEIVNCLGACALAPVMVVNGKYYGGVTKDKVKAIIDEYRGQLYGN